KAPQVAGIAVAYKTHRTLPGRRRTVMTRSRLAAAMLGLGLLAGLVVPVFAQTVVVPAPSASPPTVVTPSQSGTTVVAPPVSTVIVQPPATTTAAVVRSEEHTSELQSQS